MILYRHAREAARRYFVHPGVNDIFWGVSYTDRIPTDKLAIRFNVKEKKARAKLKASEKIPDRINGIKTDVTEFRFSRQVRNELPYERVRPLLGGVQVQASSGEGPLDWGTLGSELVFNNVRYGISNDHVLNYDTSGNRTKVNPTKETQVKGKGATDNQATGTPITGNQAKGNQATADEARSNDREGVTGELALWPLGIPEILQPKRASFGEVIGYLSSIGDHRLDYRLVELLQTADSSQSVNRVEGIIDGFMMPAGMNELLLLKSGAATGVTQGIFDGRSLPEPWRVTIRGAGNGPVSAAGDSGSLWLRKEEVPGRLRMFALHTGGDEEGRIAMATLYSTIHLSIRRQLASGKR